MRAYLRSRGFDVKASTGKTRTGDYAFEIKDPDGMLVEFVQSLPTGLEMQAAGKFQPAHAHLGPASTTSASWSGTARSPSPSTARLLGFTETWRGGANPSRAELDQHEGPRRRRLRRVHALPRQARASSAPRTTSRSSSPTSTRRLPSSSRAPPSRPTARTSPSPPALTRSAR